MHQLPEMGAPLIATVEFCQMCGEVLEDDQIMCTYGIFAVLYHLLGLMPDFHLEMRYNQLTPLCQEMTLGVAAPTATTAFGDLEQQVVIDYEICHRFNVNLDANRYRAILVQIYQANPRITYTTCT